MYIKTKSNIYTYVYTHHIYQERKLTNEIMTYCGSTWVSCVNRLQKQYAFHWNHISAAEFGLIQSKVYAE